jgi:hypothetical protein
MPVVNGQWIKGSGGAAIWSPITQADLPSPLQALAANPPGNDCNNATASGWYYITNTTTNSPKALMANGGWGHMQVIAASSSNFAVQIVYDYVTGAEFRRLWQSGGWNTPWARTDNFSCRIYRAGAAFNCPSGGFQTFPFDTAEHDTHGGMWSSGNPTVITIPEPGKYLIVVTISWAVNATGYREVAAGTADVSINASAGLNPQIAMAIVTYTATTTVSCVVVQTSGAALAATSGANQGLTIARIGPAT